MRCTPARPTLAGADHTPGATPAPELNETVGVPLRCNIGENGAPNSAAAVVEGVAPAAAAVVEDGDTGKVGGVDTRGASTVLTEEAFAWTPAAMAW